MGLDTTHGCFHGAYSAFGRWRNVVAHAADIPLHLMEGFYGNDITTADHRERYWDKMDTTIYKPEVHLLRGHYERLEEWLPIKWSCLKTRGVLWLLNHSDCDGILPWTCLTFLATDLESLLSRIAELDKQEDWGHISQAGGYVRVTQIFIDGLWLAAARGENVEFR
jgi:hypothetical protein